jgi:hypothetical protein
MEYVVHFSTYQISPSREEAAPLTLADDPLDTFHPKRVSKRVSEWVSE